MKIFRDDKKISRNSRIGQITTLGGLIVLGIGMYITFTYPDNAEMVAPAWACLLIGFLLSQVGIYFSNRFGRRPRPDEILDAALKGMDDRWTIFHYYKNLADHILIGPGGIWILKPYHQMGKLVRNPKNKRWQIKGGGIFQAYLRIFAQENIGRPDLEIQSDMDDLKKLINSKNPDLEVPVIRAVLAMTNAKAEIDVEEPSEDNIYPVLATKLKELVRKLSKENTIPQTKLTEYIHAMGGEE